MNKKTPLISICIPTYNRPKLLYQALDSCFRQTYQNFEIVICDNSTNLLSQRIIKKINDKKIRYYKNRNNIGSAKNFNRALSLTRGEYIKFLFDDDLLYPDCLEQMVSILKKNLKVGLVMAPLHIINQKGNKITPRFHLIRKMRDLYHYQNKNGLIKHNIILKDFLTRTYPCCVPTGIMIRKECIDRLGKIDENFNYIGDLELCMRIATKYDFYYINKHLSAWRLSKTSETIKILHTQTINPSLFYFLINKFYYQFHIDQYFPKKQRKTIIKDAYLFASKRAMLNSVVALKTINLKLFLTTIKTVYKSDPFMSNRIKLPFSLLKEFVLAFYHMIKS